MSIGNALLICKGNPSTIVGFVIEFVIVERLLNEKENIGILPGVEYSPLFVAVYLNVITSPALAANDSDDPAIATFVNKGVPIT